jgi:hypothetical protein
MMLVIAASHVSLELCGQSPSPSPSHHHWSGILNHTYMSAHAWPNARASGYLYVLPIKKWRRPFAHVMFTQKHQKSFVSLFLQRVATWRYVKYRKQGHAHQQVTYIWIQPHFFSLPTYLITYLYAYTHDQWERRPTSRYIPEHWLFSSLNTHGRATHDFFTVIASHTLNSNAIPCSFYYS